MNKKAYQSYEDLQIRSLPYSDVCSATVKFYMERKDRWSAQDYDPSKDSDFIFDCVRSVCALIKPLELTDKQMVMMLKYFAEVKTVEEAEKKIKKAVLSLENIFLK